MQYRVPCHVRLPLMQWLWIMSLLVSGVIQATIFPFNSDDPAQQIVGTVQTLKTQPGDTLSKIAQRYDVGFFELLEANPHLRADRPLPPGNVMVIPTRYIIPEAPHEGIRINLAEMRLYYFFPDRKHILTVPVGIGREGWMTPTGNMTIVDKRKDPTWFVPESIRVARAKEGVFLPTVVPPGPENPLGRYAMRLSQPSYLIHSTNQPSGVGRRSSSGCIRLFPEDMAQLFSLVVKGTRVRIVNQPYRIGRLGDDLYLEVHRALQEYRVPAVDRDVQAWLQAQLAARPDARLWHIDWSLARRVARDQSGIPLFIGSHLVSGGVNIASYPN